MENLFEKASEEARVAYETQANRLGQLAVLYKSRPQLLAPDENMFPDLWVGKTILRCELQALGNIMLAKGLISPDELLEHYTAAIQLFLENRERELDGLITVDGVFVPETSPLVAKENPCPSTQPQQQSSESKSTSPKILDSTSNTKPA